MNRKPYLDLLRILALFMVVFNHTALISPAREYCGHAVYWIILLADECCKMAVPLFFMVSGALLLHREEPLAMLFRKRILRFAVLIILFVGGQLFFASCISGMGWSWMRFLTSCLTGNIYSHITAAYAVWFLYGYLGMLLLLPLLRPMAQNMKNSHFILLMALQLACLVILPAISALVAGKTDFFLNSFLPFADGVYPPFCWTHCTFYALLGYFMEHRIRNNPSARQMVGLGAASALLLFTGCVAIHLTQGNNIDLNPFLKSFLMVPCCFLFLAARKYCGSAALPISVQRLVTYLAGGVFAGIMLENVLRHLLLPCIYAYIGHSYAAACMAAGAVGLAALACGVGLKLIPGLRKII